ncbi:MAG: NAD(P)H-dependent oxidoreductase [Acidimicrobiales bacterium]
MSLLVAADAPTLVVVSHPRADSLTRAALDRVLAGLEHAGAPVELLDLDAEGFDPVLTLEERRGHLTHTPADRPELVPHIEALQGARRLVLVYPTWFGGQPARLKGWFDRVWMNEVAFDLPPGADRLRPRLRNLREIHVVTTHGSPRWINAVQGNPGKMRLFRAMRNTCHPLCRPRWTALYDLDSLDRSEIEAWLDRVERRFG